MTGKSVFQATVPVDENRRGGPRRGGAHTSADIEAERCYLCCILLTDTVLDTTSLVPLDFYRQQHQQIFEQMLRLRRSKRMIDPVTICDGLAASGRALDIAEVSDILRAECTSHAARSYAEIILDHSVTRQISQAIHQVMTSGLRGQMLLSLVLEAVSRLRHLGASRTEAISEVVSNAIQDIASQIKAETGRPVGIPTGLRSLDLAIGGLPREVLSIVAGRPSHGKSSLARTIADGANAAGCGVHVFSLEDSSRSYAYRALSDHSRVGLGRIRSLQLDRADMDALLSAGENLYQRRKWLLDDSPALSASQIGIRVRQHLAINVTELVVVDYVQLMRIQDREMRTRDKGDEVARCAEQLAALAREEKVSVLLLSQLSRDCEKRDDKRPMLSDLRESGVLEQVADVVMFCYRESLYQRGGNDAEATIVIGKNKHGSTGEAVVAWDSSTATYRDPPTRTNRSAGPVHVDMRAGVD